MKTYRIISLVLCLVLAFSCASCSCKVFSDPIEDATQTTKTGETEPTPESGIEWTVLEEATCSSVGKAQNNSSGIIVDIPMKDHAFNQYVPDSKHLAEGANCYHGDIYYLSCTCGKAGSETFESGYMTQHNYVDGKCTLCNQNWSEGLVFTSNGDGTCCLKSIGECKDNYVRIPETSPAGDRVTALGADAFSNASNVETISIPEGVTSIGNHCFSKCSVKRVYFPSTLRDIGVFAFTNSSLTNVALPEGLETLANAAFASCSECRSLSLPSTLKEIRKYTPGNSYSPFHCSPLKLVFIDSLEHAYNIKMDTPINAFRVAYPTELYAGGVKTNELYITGSMDYDWFGYFFENTSNIHTITISNTVTELPQYRSAFAHFTELKKVVFEEGSKIKIGLGFSQCFSLEEVVLPEGLIAIEANVFENCESLKHIEIPESVMWIRQYAFRFCKALESITIPSSVTEIGRYAFGHCHNLKEVILSNGIETIGDNAFEMCYSLESIKIPDSVTKLGIEVFYWCESLKSVEFGSGITAIPTSCFAYCNSLETLPISDSITEIRTGAFEHCLGLENIVIPDNVTTIGQSAFSSTENLRSITIGNGVKIIPNAAFSNCTSLTEVVLPTSLNSISKSAFENCSSLYRIVIPASTKFIGTQAFDGCYNLIEVVNLSDLNIYATDTGNGMVAFYARFVLTDPNVSYIRVVDSFVFCTKPNLTLVEYLGNDAFVSLPVLPESYGIGQYAFWGKDSMLSITIPSMVRGIHRESLRYISSLLEICNLSNCEISVGPNCNLDVACNPVAESLVTNKADALYTLKDDFIFYNSDDGWQLFDYIGNESQVYLPEYAPDGSVYKITEDTRFFTSDSDFLYIPDSVKIASPLPLFLVGDITLRCSYCGDNAQYLLSEFDSNTKKLILGSDTGIIPASVQISAKGGDDSENNSVIEIELEPGITEIQNRAFIDHRSLKSVLLSKELEALDLGAFENCTDLEKIAYPGTIEEWKTLNITGSFNGPENEVYLYCSDSIIRLK